MNAETTWEKVLWKHQGFPDNYVPPSFLSELRRNTHFQPYTYSAVMLASCSITQHISVLFIFLAVFARLYNDTLDPRLLAGVTICCYFTGYFIWELVELRGHPLHLEIRAKMVKSILFILVALIILSPGLRTLTAATSSDSIWALSACLFSLHVLLADYGSTSQDTIPYARLSSASAISINAAVFSSVVLASRLSTDNAVFALTLFSFNSFALFPFARIRIQAAPTLIQMSFTILMGALSLYLILSLSPTVAWLLVCIFLLVTFVAPGILVWAQRYKNNIKGPWDVAIPQIR